MSCVNLEKAKMLLVKTDSTCVLCNGQIILTDKRRGVRPLLDLLEGDANVAGFAAADKVVGKAAAYLYCLLNIKCLYAQVISQPALDVLTKTGIQIEYGQLVPAIQNRTKDGFCPMESAVLKINTPEEALRAIYDALEQLKK
jgi:hypothetical protein